jgi:hypothetical protein
LLPLPHFVDCCLPPQFLLLSATTIATVVTTATTDPVSTAVIVAVNPQHHLSLHRLCLSTCPPLPLNVPLPHLAPARQTLVCLLLRIPHPSPAGFSFGCWTPADKWTNMGAMLGFWSVGVL